MEQDKSAKRLSNLLADLESIAYDALWAYAIDLSQVAYVHL